MPIQQMTRTGGSNTNARTKRLFRSYFQIRAEQSRLKKSNKPPEHSGVPLWKHLGERVVTSAKY